MSDRLTKFIPYNEIIAKLQFVFELVDKFPPDFTSAQWQAILNGSAITVTFPHFESSFSTEQLDAYKKLVSVIDKAKLSEATDLDKALSAIYKTAIIISRILPGNVATALFESIQLESEYLDLSNMSIDDKQAEAIAIVLPCTNISSINLWKNNINGRGAIALVAAGMLTSLNLGSNHIISDEVAMALGASTTLESLDLEESNFSVAGHRALASNQYLRKLNLANSHVNSISASIYAESQALRHLNLDGNQLDADVLNKLGLNLIFLSLSLRNNRIDDVVAKKYADSTTLRRLDLSDNNISDEGAKAFVKSNTLESLNLSKNKLSNLAVAAFSATQNLSFIDVSHNGVSSEAVEAMWEKNPTTGYNNAIKAGAKATFPSLATLSTFAVKKIPNLPEETKQRLPPDLQERINKNKV